MFVVVVGGAGPGVFGLGGKVGRRAAASRVAEVRGGPGAKGRVREVRFGGSVGAVGGCGGWEGDGVLFGVV